MKRWSELTDAEKEAVKMEILKLSASLSDISASGSSAQTVTESSKLNIGLRVQIIDNIAHRVGCRLKTVDHLLQTICRTVNILSCIICRP